MNMQSPVKLALRSIATVDDGLMLVVNLTVTPPRRLAAGRHGLRRLLSQLADALRLWCSTEGCRSAFAPPG
jgi:hypothetical protein